jgi:surface protein
MFPTRGAAAFNGDVSTWNTSSATTMEWMFYGTAVFNRNVSTSKVSSKVTSMEAMFQDAVSFRGDVSTWDLSSVSDRIEMFYGIY